MNDSDASPQLVIIRRKHTCQNEVVATTFVPAFVSLAFSLYCNIYLNISLSVSVRVCVSLAVAVSVSVFDSLTAFRPDFLIPGSKARTLFSRCESSQESPHFPLSGF